MTKPATPGPAGARISAGIPATNSSLYWRTGFPAGDPVALVELGAPCGAESVLILRDIEMERARKTARATRVACPADYPPSEGLSGDRETATAQAAAECLRRAGVARVSADRSLPLIYAEFLKRAGIAVDCDLEMWVRERRQKSEKEIEYLAAAQRVTEEAIRMACEMVASASARRDGVLERDGSPLTAERVRAAVDHFLLDRGFVNPLSIIAGGPTAADCHNVGSGDLKTGMPVIVDIFPQDRKTRYNGDCTRTVVHGEIRPELLEMHRAVCEANAAAKAAIAPGVTGEDVHAATVKAITARGFSVGLPGENAPLSYCALTHGTGHGIGLDVHEPPLLDRKGPELLAGDAVTVEPGLYRRDLGGIRVEDIVIVTDKGARSLNALPDGLRWK